FDGVSGTSGTELATPEGYGKIEYAYHRMAVEAGIEMAPCRLHPEGGRSHFMTKRFDRTESGDKFHLQSLAAIAHFDYLQPSSYSYEQAIQVIQQMRLHREDLEQHVLRAIFNVVGRNRDDHVKNTAFLMTRRGEWRLSPAFDISYAWNPRRQWTRQHQMSVNGKRDGIERTDLIALARAADIKTSRANEMIDRILGVFRQWPDFAEQVGVSAAHIAEVERNLHTKL
ncbi:MAG: HipA domain-containing protein, partial [Candidatus Bipolaricaulota bacterium]|nr:HipA domain-containing protein [Candidatus Bipolaricaulota bacterium]